MSKTDSIQVLASMGGPGIGSSSLGALVPRELRPLLLLKNGFYAFNGALHVFPSQSPPSDLETWNASDSWRSAYGDLAQGHLFFAEDVFGGQFSLMEGGIWSFDPETGEADRLADSIDEWAKLVLSDHEVLVGSELAAQWTAKHGPLRIGSRLVPRQLFVLGGEFELSNLVERDGVWIMKALGPIAQQLVDVPDGVEIVFNVDHDS